MVKFYQKKEKRRQIKEEIISILSNAERLFAIEEYTTVGGNYKSANRNSTN